MRTASETMIASARRSVRRISGSMNGLQRAVRHDVGMPMHHQRSVAAQSQREYQVAQWKWRMQRQQIVLRDPAPQPQRIGRRNRKRHQIAERANALDRDVAHDQPARSVRTGTDQSTKREPLLQPAQMSRMTESVPPNRSG